MTDRVRQTILDVFEYHRPKAMERLNWAKTMANDNPDLKWAGPQRDKAQAELDLYDQVLSEVRAIEPTDKEIE